MYTITCPVTPRDRLPRKPKKALRAVQRGRGTSRQQKLAQAFLLKGLRVTTPYVGFNKTGEYLVVSKHRRSGYPPIKQTLETLMIELLSYGYEPLCTDVDNYDRTNSYIFHLPLMAKCRNGHYTPIRKVTRRRPQCQECDQDLWAGAVQHDRVLLWQGQEYAADDETTMPVPSMIEIFYDFNGVERPRPPIPPKGQRRRRYIKALKRWNDIQWGIHYTQVGEEIAREQMEDFRKEYATRAPVDRRI